MSVLHHKMVTTLVNLKGNPKACVYTEPLWGIPYNLFAPYVSLYMYALGITDKQIGLLATIGMIFQIVSALLSGIITDMLGRKRTTFIFDILSWSVPCLIWAVAQNFTYFLVAAIFNSIWRITANSWSCLLVEDCESTQLVDVYGWIHISGLIAAFFAPLAGVLVAKYTLVPTVRLLYIFSFVLMTTKFLVLNIYATETQQGAVRLEKTRNESIAVLLKQYKNVIINLFKNTGTMMTLAILIIMSISTMINNTFWSLLITEHAKIPVEIVSIFPFIKSSIMLFFYFTIVHKLSVERFKKPMVLGFCFFIVSQLLLISAPEKGYITLVISIFLEAVSLSLINPLMDSLLATTVDPKERARILAVLYVVIIAITSPFGYIGGYLSSINRILPFMMNILLFALGALITYKFNQKTCDVKQ